jgi:glycosylphosphatidylinositol transamidase
MPDAYTFIPISKYIGPIIIVIASTILGSLSIWWDSGSIEIKGNQPPKQYEWIYQQRPIDLGSFSNRIRPIYMPLLSLSASFAFCGYIFKYMSTISYLLSHDFGSGVYIFCSILVAQQTVAWFFIPLIQRMFCGETGSTRSTVVGSWYMLKCFVYGLQGMFLLGLTAINPSLSLAYGVVMFPITMIIRPTGSFPLLFLQSLFLTMVSPPVLLLIWGILGQNFIVPWMFLADLCENWNTFGAIFLPLMCLFYWPINITLQVMATMEK